MNRMSRAAAAAAAAVVAVVVACAADLTRASLNTSISGTHQHSRFDVRLNFSTDYLIKCLDASLKQYKLASRLVTN